MAIPRLILLVLISLRLLGGDSGIPQMVAWAGMLVSRAPDQGLTAAIESTFDGAHPCALCTAIRTVEESSPPREPVNIELLSKLKIKDLVRAHEITVDAPVRVAECPRFSCGTMTETACARRDAPPVPPPRLNAQV